MKLDKFLKKQKPDTMIYIGTKNGSNWLYIETAAELLDHLDTHEEKLHKDITKCLDDANAVVKQMPKVICELTEKLDKEVFERTKNEYLIKIEKAETKFANVYLRRKEATIRLHKWKTLNNRNIVENYSCHDWNIPGVAVILEGFENGEWWAKGKKVHESENKDSQK